MWNHHAIWYEFIHSSYQQTRYTNAQLLLILLRSSSAQQSYLHVRPTLYRMLVCTQRKLHTDRNVRLYKRLLHGHKWHTLLSTRTWTCKEHTTATKVHTYKFVAQRLILSLPLLMMLSCKQPPTVGRARAQVCQQTRAIVMHTGVIVYCGLSIIYAHIWECLTIAVCARTNAWPAFFSPSSHERTESRKERSRPHREKRNEHLKGARVPIYIREYL